MAFELEKIVPWGRNLEEYKLMFNLSEVDLKMKIAGFGDGPASFNMESTLAGYDVTSYDPIYGFSKDEIKKRIEDTSEIVIKQMEINHNNYLWDKIKDIKELKDLRMSAMNKFLEDYESGKKEKRYICHELPNKIKKEDSTYEIGLSSHFLLMYTSLGYDFHIKAIEEMLRVCEEVRIFPIVDLDGKESDLSTKVIKYFNKKYVVKIIKTEYEFQKGDNKLCIIKNY